MSSIVSTQVLLFLLLSQDGASSGVRFALRRCQGDNNGADQGDDASQGAQRITESVSGIHLSIVSFSSSTDLESIRRDTFLGSRPVVGLSLSTRLLSGTAVRETSIQREIIVRFA